MTTKLEVTEEVIFLWDMLLTEYFDNPDWSMRSKKEVYVQLLKDAEYFERELEGDRASADVVLKEWLLDTDMGNWRV